MANDHRNTALVAMFPMIAKRLREAASISDAANACAAAGNPDGAFRILLDIETLTTDAITLLNAASLLHRERDD
jgi:hypothetical protein